MENRVYVGNLPDDVSVEALRERFAQFGAVTEVHLATDRSSGRMRGHAFVTMASAAEAHVAMTELNGAEFDDRRLRVSMAGAERDKSKAAGPDRAKITSQFRERLNMVYELDCAGTALVIKMFPEDLQEQTWRVEVSTKAAAGALVTEDTVVTASGPTRGAALEEIVRACQGSGTDARLSAVDWAAISKALAAVRAI